MTVKELREVLGNYNDSDVVLFKPENSRYVESFSENIKEKEVSAFYGDDYKALVICSNGQQGQI